jgi:hypothetical protein
MKCESRYSGLGIALGAALGVAFGVIAGNVAVWLAVGVAIGLVLGASMRQRQANCRVCDELHQSPEDIERRAR